MKAVRLALRGFLSTPGCPVFCHSTHIVSHSCIRNRLRPKTRHFKQSKYVRHKNDGMDSKKHAPSLLEKGALEQKAGSTSPPRSATFTQPVASLSCTLEKCLLLKQSKATGSSEINLSWIKSLAGLLAQCIWCSQITPAKVTAVMYRCSEDSKAKSGKAPKDTWPRGEGGPEFPLLSKAHLLPLLQAPQLPHPAPHTSHSVLYTTGHQIHPKNPLTKKRKNTEFVDIFI